MLACVLQQLETPATAGRVLGVSAGRVRQLDPELQPLRTRDGRRVYDAAQVDRVAAQRDFARACTVDSFRTAKRRGRKRGAK